MADLMGKRKYAGPTVAERRKTDERPKMHLSPHKKPRAWVLTVEWTETKTVRRQKAFTSRAARDESRRRIERHMAEATAKNAPKKYKRWWTTNSPWSEYGDEEVHALKEAPRYIESYADDSQADGGAES